MTGIYKRTRNKNNITELHVYFYRNTVTYLKHHKLLIIIYFSCHCDYEYHKSMTFYGNLLRIYVKNKH